MALITIYGGESVNEATAELMLRGVAGAENLEMLLKSRGPTSKRRRPCSSRVPNSTE